MKKAFKNIALVILGTAVGVVLGDKIKDIIAYVSCLPDIENDYMSGND